MVDKRKQITVLNITLLHFRSVRSTLHNIFVFSWEYFNSTELLNHSWIFLLNQTEKKSVYWIHYHVQTSWVSGKIGTHPSKIWDDVNFVLILIFTQFFTVELQSKTQTLPLMTMRNPSRRRRRNTHKKTYSITPYLADKHLHIVYLGAWVNDIFP